MQLINSGYLFWVISVWVTLVFWQTFNVTAQTEAEIQEIAKLLSTTKEKDKQLPLYDQMVQLFIYSNLDQAEYYNDSLLHLAQELKNEPFFVRQLLHRAVIFRGRGHLEQADSILDIAIEKSAFVGDPKLQRQTIYQKGAHLHFMEQREESLRYLFAAADSAQKSSDLKLLAKAYNVIGINYKQIGNANMALEYYAKSLAASSQIKDTTSVMIAHNSMGVMWMKLDSVPAAKAAFEKALKLALAKNNKTVAGHQYRNLGVIAQMRSNYQVAETYFEKGLSIREEMGTPLQILGSHYDLGENARLQGRFSKAEQELRSALEIAEDLNSLSSESYVLQSLGKLYEETAQHEQALAVFKRSQAIQDSIHSTEINKKILSLEAEFDDAQKRAQLAENELIIKKRTGQRNLFLLAALISLITLLFFWNRHHLLQRLSWQNAEIHEQRIAELEAEKRITNMSSMIEGQEAERRRIAKDLHDGLGGLLATVKTSMGQIQSEISKLEKLDVYQKANQMIDQACEEVRRISHNMIPGVLRIEGLQGALEDIIAQLKYTHQFKVDAEIDFQAQAISEGQSHMIYRIMQECCNNIIKHSQAKEIVIQLMAYDDHLHLLVEDDGIGFDPRKDHEGLGLQSIRSRVDFLEGDLDLASSQSGTSISINLPIRSNV